MELSEIKEIVNRFLSDEFEVEEEKMSDTSRIKEDLKIDSLDFVDIAVEVEKRFKFKVTPTEMQDIATLGEFYDMIYKKQQ